jgi:hypothetical protein
VVDGLAHGLDFRSEVGDARHEVGVQTRRRPDEFAKRLREAEGVVDEVVRLGQQLDCLWRDGALERFGVLSHEHPLQRLQFFHVRFDKGHQLGAVLLRASDEGVARRPDGRDVGSGAGDAGVGRGCVQPLDGRDEIAKGWLNDNAQDIVQNACAAPLQAIFGGLPNVE